MRNFDWKQFCIDYNIEFLERGVGIGKGKIGTQCTYCDDSGYHMGLSLDVKSPWWSCWRCKAGGSDPLRLICKLANVTTQQAQALLEAQNTPSPDEFDSLFTAPRAAPLQQLQRSIKLPPECHPLASEKKGAERFLRYLAEDRGFGEDVKNLALTYSLYYATAGTQAWRIVYPVIANGKLVSYTGRSIHENAELRYKVDEGGAIKNYVANADELLDGDEMLAITEGPMDFLKLDYFGKHHGLRATCTFGIAWTQAQLDKLITLTKEFKQVFVIYDREAYMSGVQLADELSAFTPCKAIRLPPGDKDPGAMSPSRIKKFIKELENT